jgi:ABC-type multidrug transport system fused ATPase/permease subunit
MDEKKENVMDGKKSLAYFISGMKDYWSLLAGEKRVMMVYVFWIAFLQALALGFHLILKELFDEIPRLVELGGFSRYAIALVVALFTIKMLALTLKRFALEIRFLKSLIKLENSWPVAAHKKLMELSLGYHEKENTGKKLDKINKGCDRMVDITARLRWGFLPQLFYVIINVCIIIFIDWRLGAFFFLPFIPAAYLYFKAFQKAAPAFEEWEKEKEKSTGLFCQSVINIQTVQSYVQEEKEKTNFEAIREKMRQLDEKATIRMQVYFFIAISTLYVFFMITVLYGILLVIKGESSVGTLVYIISTGSVTFEGLWILVHEYTEILRRLIAVERMKKLLDEEPAIKNSPNAVMPVYKGKFSFEDVYFTYEGKKEPVLKGINIEIAPGEMIAFVGRSGEGKTTMTKLLSRMFDVKKGRITLDGTDIKNIDLFWLRRKFAIVSQDVDIFDASILDNIRYSYSDASLEDVQKAIKAAFLEKVLNDKRRFPKGIHEQVGEKGVRLSGGERQRVGIARAYLALLNGAKILILDEATSNLDSQAELAIQKMIGSLRNLHNFTIVAIAHRLSTIRRADRIFVINDGTIIEKGDHNRLLAKNGLYAKLVELQTIGEIRD